MNYKQSKAFADANENLIFHTHNPQARWCFSRAHLVYAATGDNQIDFRFPLYQVKVQVKQSAAELLEVALNGEASIFTDVPHELDGNDSPQAISPTANQVSRITVSQHHPEFE